MKNNYLFIALYFVMFVAHFFIFRTFIGCCEVTFIKYYLFLTLLFVMTITLMSIFKKLYPDYLGFIFMGLVLFKLAMMFLIMNKLHLSEVPSYKFNFILPYLGSLTLITLYSMNLIQKDEKNQ